MWLDGLYMAEPFFAEYASISHHSGDFNDITHQFVVLMEQHAPRSPGPACSTTVGTNRSRSAGQQQTGDSSEFWARGMGWYMMALVDDTLD